MMAWKWLAPLAVACLAAIVAHQRRHADATGDDDPVSLMQNYAQINNRGRPAAQAQDVSFVQAESSIAASASAASMAESTAESMAASSAEAMAAHAVTQASMKAMTFQHLEPCSDDYEPVTQQVSAEVLRGVGLMPPRQLCRPVALIGETVAVAGTNPNTHKHTRQRMFALAVPITYAVIFGIIISRMLHFVLTAKPKAVDKRPVHVRNVRRPEADAWKAGLVSWLSISWANEWIARWGNVTTASATSVRADELDALGDAEDEPAVGYKRLLPLWDEELRKKGMKDASLMMVMIRFVTIRRLLMLALWTTGYEVAMYVGPPMAMTYTINYVVWLYTIRIQGFEVPQSVLGIPSLMVIVTFTGLPLMMGICNTVSSFLSQRMAIQSCGALSSLVVKKAQCLPVTVEALEAQIREAKLEYEGQDGEDSDDEILQGTPEEKKLEASLAEEDNSKWMAPEQFNLVQVVANDINMSFVQIPLQFVRVVIIIPVVITLFILLWIRVQLTIFLVLGTCLVMTWLLLRSAGGQVTYLMGFLYHAGNRLQYLETTMHSIRTVKACGWEGIINWKILGMRNTELSALESYYWRLGIMYTVVYSVPKSMIFVSVFGYHWLYPEKPAVNIFATLPLLFTAQNAIMSLLQTLPQLVNAKPAIMRCEKFLKQIEAPIGRPKDEKVPEWLHLWPKEQPSNGLKKELDTGMRDSMRVKGDFAWKLDGKPMLKEIDIDLPSGKCLAVVGKTGSGKTTLLHAILGELYPLKDSCLEVPAQVAYSAQVPYVCEGTLRENVLFGEPIDEEHYKKAIFSACLLPELDTLPGGEEVPIGSRGISLSGGQKARVSMARAAYNSGRGGLVLVDDPFGAVDSRTARHLLDHYIHGEGLEGRTRVVVTQPDPERIMRFDEVAIMRGGRLVVRGPPSEVMETDEYKALLDSHQLEALGTQPEELAVVDPNHGQGSGGRRKAPDVFQLREEEFQGRIDWPTIDYFCGEGGWFLINFTIALFLFLQVTYLMMNVMLQRWSTDQMLLNAGVGAHAPIITDYLRGYIIWWILSYVVWGVCWFCGVSFTLSMSTKIFKTTIAGLLHAPVDRFFDRTPVGRIMNRLSSDLMNLDNNTYNHITIMIGLLWTTGVPLAYVHILMPLYFSFVTIPIYYLIFALIRRYWNTMVPMRYLTHVSKSQTDDILTEVAHSNTSVRAMQKAGFRLAVFQSLLSNQMKADVTTTLVLNRWLVNRMFLLLGFVITTLVLLAVWVPAIISFGGIGLCMCNCWQIVTGCDGYISSAANAQFQFISLNRLYEYTRLTQEKPNDMPDDGKYMSFGMMLTRLVLGKLIQREKNGLKQILRVDSEGKEELVLVQVEGGESFQAPDNQTLTVLAETGLLVKTAPWHRIIAANGIRGSAQHIADILCSDKAELGIEVQSGWLANGVEIAIEDLRTGYGDIPRDILKDVNVVIEARSKAGIVGTTGCGKSTLLLSLLRILEPRDGRIVFNSVDTQLVGLQVLRNAIGLVPQDPVLMQASVRENLDPWGLYHDDEIWKGLQMVQLENTIKQMDYGIYTPIAQDGGNLSYGQRQLLCLARTVIRQNSLILLDEATSALDPHTQELVQTTIQSSFPGSTIVVIAHRLETILNFDQIIVMEQGNIVERGTAADLSTVKGGTFAKMLAAKRTW